MTLVAPTLQAFFTDRLTRQLQASPRTIASYRDTLRLLLCFTQENTGKQPSKLDWSELNETVITAFLAHLETDRHNTARTRNLRLTAIRSLFKYAALRHPEHASEMCIRDRPSGGSPDPPFQEAGILKSCEETMRILEAFDLTGTLRGAAELAGCDHHTVARCVAARDAGQLVGKMAPRGHVLDPWLEKIEEWVERSSCLLYTSRCV